MKSQIFLTEVHIKNFLSLHQVSLPLKPLTILVGPNASGKSNILKALSLLTSMMVREKLPQSDDIQHWIWAGDPFGKIHFEIHVKANNNLVTYALGLQAYTDNPIYVEKLNISQVQVISIENGKGEIQDEDGRNLIKYASPKLALKSAGDYGEKKPVTSHLTRFIKEWEFFNFMPEVIRGKNLLPLMATKHQLEMPTRLDDEGSLLKHLLYAWYQRHSEHFNSVSESLQSVTQFGLGTVETEEDKLGLLEGYDKPIPLSRASDGTLRLLAYYTLLEQPSMPSLIAIEEPERNLHPDALIKVANLLEELAERTQVIITTHSSQLLDLFNKDKLGHQLGVLLLQNPLGVGTQIINLEQQHDREALRSWIDEFGIGSAIFDSGLFFDMREK